jgi:protein-S-isoprenylcysteine O-methyltransferase Ste14
MNERGERKQMDNSFEAVGAVELIEKSVEDGRDLIRLEIDLAKDELLHDLRSARSAAILAAIAIALALNAFASLLVALGVAVGASVVAYVGLALLVTAAVLAFAALRTMPKAPLASTLRRLEADKVTLTESLT